MEKLDTSVRSEQKGIPMTDTTSNTAVLDTEFAGLETRETHAWFGNHHALAGVSLQFPARSVTGLIGPSGCGKSTYLRLLNRMHEFIPGAAMAGEVRLHGQDIYAREVIKEGDVYTNKIIGVALENHSDAYAVDCSF